MDPLRVVLQTVENEEEKYINAVFVNVRTAYVVNVLKACQTFKWWNRVYALHVLEYVEMSY